MEFGHEGGGWGAGDGEGAIVRGRLGGSNEEGRRATGRGR